MGRERRSRRVLQPDTLCYLCSRAIEDGEEWNRDHIPPRRFFGKSIRTLFNPNLEWLPTHNHCNSEYKSDEEYYVASFVGHANSESAEAVMADFRRGVAKGHDIALLKLVTGQFGRVVRLDGGVIFNYDAERAGRVTWKIVRGIYFKETGVSLPEDTPKRLHLLGPEELKTLHEDHPWFHLVRDTEPLGNYARVFDYKWLGTIGEGHRTHVIAMLLWDAILTLALFHDPRCSCKECLQTGVEGLAGTERGDNQRAASIEPGNESS